jgi:hypothetical protein
VLDPAVVGDVADRLLAAVVAGYAAHAVTLPDRRYVAPSAPELVAHDCEQVTVALGIVAQRPVAPTGHPSPAPVYVVPVAAFEVRIIRDVPAFDGEGIPSADYLAAVGAAVLLDAGVLLSVLLEVITTGALLPDAIPGGHNVDVPVITTVGPSGGLGGVAARVTVDLV